MTKQTTPHGLAPTTPNAGVEVKATALCPTCGAPGVEDACDSCGWLRADPRLGVVLDGKYRIDALIGAGGMGRVYRATHTQLGEPVAVKFLLSHWAKTPEIRARFRREAVALARIRHPSIVSVLDFGEHADELYMVMELVKGAALAHRLAQGTPLPLPRIARIIDQVLEVLETAHAQGIVHRDLKPENVMLVESVGSEDRIKVLDFGLAYVADEGGGRLTETGVAHGTPHYMSPEQCRGHEVGAPTDIYAVGILLYETLAGRVPFDGDDAASIMAQQMFVDPPPMQSVGFGRKPSAGFDEVVRQALRKKPDERPSAAGLRDLLAQAAKGTDAASIAANAAEVRTRSAALSRTDRAFTGVQAAVPQATVDVARKKVSLRLDDRRQSEGLRNALAVRGVAATIDGAEATSDEVSVVVVGHEGAEAVLGRRAGRPELAVVAVGVPDVARLTALARLGVSDAVLEGGGDDDICRKVLRILQRGR